MSLSRTLLLLSLGTLSGCGSMSYRIVEAGSVEVNGMRLTPSSNWNLTPWTVVDAARDDAQVWTHDGVYLDRLYIIPAVADDELLFAVDRTDDMPRFRSTMSAEELESLIASSLPGLFGAQEVAVRTSAPRSHTFGKDSGVVFEVFVAPEEEPDMRGLAGAFVSNGRLYAVIFMAPEAHYYGKHVVEARSIIEGARL